MKTRIAFTLILVIGWLMTACSAVQMITSTPQGDPLAPPAAVTPEVFIARTQTIPAQVQLNGIMLAVQEAHLGECDLPDCPPAPNGTHYLRVTLQALNMSADQFLDYKNLPQGIAIHDDTGTVTPFNRLFAYMPADQRLTLYFTVPESAKVFGLQWPNVAEIPLTAAIVEMPATQTPSFVGLETTYGVLTLVVPPAVSIGASGAEFPRVDGADAAEWQKTPGHLQVMLGEYYALQGKSQQPTIYVYPAQTYAELVPAAFESMNRLNNILGNPSAPIDPKMLPAIPFFNTRQVFASHIEIVSFQNGKGVRFLTEYAQYPASANNSDLFYTFIGSTNDGVYYIVAVLPITHPQLAETSDGGAVLPVGGVPYYYFSDPQADMMLYYTSVVQMLNTTPPDAFIPTIGQLDLLIQSMRIAP